MPLTKSLFATTALTALIAVGCEDRTTGLNQPGNRGGGAVAVTPQEIRAAARRNLTETLTGWYTGTEITGESDLAGRIDLPGDSAPCAEPRRTPGTGNEPAGGGCDETPASRAADTADDWVERFLNLADIETADTRAVTWKLNAARLCEGGRSISVKPGQGDTDGDREA